MPTVIVHSWKRYDITKDAHFIASTKRTAADIEKCKGEIILGTAEEVSEEALDDQRRYSPPESTR